MSKPSDNRAASREAASTADTDAHTDVTEPRPPDDQQRLVDKMEALIRLADGISHEFNNVLTAVNGYSQLLTQMLPEDGPHKVYLEEICQAGERGADLTAKLMLLTRRHWIRPQVVDLGDVVEGLRGRLRQTIGDDVRLETSRGPEPGHVEADYDQIERIVLDLAANAGEAMPDGGRLSIGVSNVDFDSHYRGMLPGPYVCLTVADSGTGIESDVMERMFEPMFSTKKGKGLGFGLAVVYAAVSRCRGYVQVDSRGGEGTVFRIYLPRVDP